MQAKPKQGRPRSLARLKASLHRAGITQQQVALAAGVVVPTVCHVLAGRAVSANVVGTAKRLLAAHQNGAEKLAAPSGPAGVLESTAAP